MTILIAGGGIAGLTAALSLHQIGIPCRVFETVTSPRPLGVGINVLPHAVRELTQLGLAGTLAETAIPTAELAYYSKHGKHIWSEPRGRDAGYNWPQYSVHRGVLQLMLLEAARTRLGPQNILTGHHLEAWTETPTGIIAHLSDKRSGARLPDQTGDLLIGADGIHSVVRQTLYPNQGPPIWNGAILWRGTAHAAPFLTGRSMVMVGHDHLKFVAYPIAPATNGQALINWIAERKFRPGHAWQREDWNRPGSLSDFLPWYHNWRFDWLDVPALIQSADACFEYPMVDRDPLPRWTFGRTTLLGDAAHPMYPIGSNGASQGILDARVLAREIRRCGPSPAALLAYEAERRPATAKIVLAHRAGGPDHIMEMVEQRAPHGFHRIEDVLTVQEFEDTAANYKKLAGFDRDALNARAPIV